MARNLLNHQQRVTGAVLAVAERRKRAAYPELLRRGLQRLCVLAFEIGGRWNDESLRLVAQLVRSRALRAPAPHRGAATQGWCRAYSCGCAKHTLAATLLGSPPVHAAMPGAQAPPLQDVLHDACPPVPSCLAAAAPLQCRGSQVHWDRARIARKGRWVKKNPLMP